MIDVDVNPCVVDPGPSRLASRPPGTSCRPSGVRPRSSLALAASTTWATRQNDGPLGSSIEPFGSFLRCPQSQYDYVFDSTKFETHFGFTPTSCEEDILATAKAHG